MDEAKLTAYALGELSGTERAAVAAHLVGNAEARQYVADVRATANLLGDQLARESFGGLTDLQHAVIEQKLDDAMRLPIARARFWQHQWNTRGVLVMSMAASVLIVFGVLSVLVPYIYQHIDNRTVTHAPDTTNGPEFYPFNVIRPKDVKPPQLPAFAQRPSAQFPAPVAHDADEASPDDVDLPWVPAPDNRLASTGSGREETPLPEKLVGVGATDNGHPTVPVPVVHGPPGPTPPPVARVEPTLPSNNPVPNPGGSRYDSAYVPPGTVSPDKIPQFTERSPNGMLPGGEQYAHLRENPFIDTAVEPMSGFSAGVDTASYSNIRRFLTHGKLPPHDAVRIEEMLNYFPVRSAAPDDGPLALQVELGACPWRPELRLARVCLQARELPAVSRPPANLVLVIDVSDSMRKEKAKLPMLKQALRLLAGRLTARDHISIIAYRQEPGIVLPPTADDKQAVWAALERLESVGQIVGGKGIEAAYDLANRNYQPGGVNRIILATDGNWNVGITNRDRLAAIAREQSAKHISLSILGVGMENLNDVTLQQLASAGNGSYAYIDTLAEARKVLVDQIDGALVSRARDVKVQVNFDRAVARSYRLIGYERRGLTADELASHSRPGGDLGAGQSVTALYEVEPVPGASSATRPADMLTAAVTYVDPVTQAPKFLTASGEDRATPLPRTSTEFRFAAAVAEFGLVLRDSDYKNRATYSTVLNHLQEATGPDDTGYRRELVNLVQKARELAGK